MRLVVVASILMSSGCFSNWKPVDVDGDGITPLDGDCWDSPDPPPQIDGALSHNLTAGDIYTGAVDTPYDGIDANCDGSDDFDADGDGWVPIEYAGIATYGIQGSGTEQNIGDCWDDPSIVIETLNDFDALTPDLVNSGASERWYDGIDQDCDSQSDFDQDLDGQDSSDYGGTDCNDLDIEIFEGAVEVFYDGIDQDCLGGDDCDADGDTYPGTPDGFPSDVCPSIEDCDDTNANVYPDPTVAEVFYNGLDDDCNPQTGDGDADSDGHWSHEYEDLMADAGIEPLVDPNGADRDCWDADVSDVNFSIPTEFQAQNGFDQPEPSDVYPGAPDPFYDAIDSDCLGGDDFDADGDGFSSKFYNVGDDCFDTEADNPDWALIVPPQLVNPNAQEIWYDTVDGDCNGLSDFDQDLDGFDSSTDLDPFNGYGTDCNDINPSIYPNAPELVDDGVDQDCDNGDTCYVDFDSDGFRNPDTTLTVTSSDLDCDDLGEGSTSELATDCDDSESTTFPNAPELVDDGVDQNCDNGETCYVDLDSDGFRSPDTSLTVDSSDMDCNDLGEGSSLEPATDCDDSESDTFPGAAELESSTACMQDLDQDGYGDSNASGSIISGLDCDDGNELIHPDSSEDIDNGVDQDCDGFELCYEDADSDGFRNTDVSLTVFSSDLDCDDSGEGSSGEPATDCDDTDALSYPNATEVVADGIDQSCDTTELCYVDLDSDGFRNPDTSLTVSSSDLDCNDSGEGSLSEPATDCDDSVASIFPGAPENVDDGIDQDCDSGDTCFADLDSDGFRAIDTTLTVSSTDLDCDDSGEGSGNEPATDCDDSEATTYPGAPEAVDDGIDQDCDNGDTCFVDFDSDGFRNPDTSLTVSSSDLDCNDNGEGNSGELATDCNDSEASTFPGAPEVVDDGVDQDCDNGDTCFVDFDSDGFRHLDTSLTVSSSDMDCDDSGEGSSSEPATDCDDANATIYPGTSEFVADGIDQNCDNLESCYVDSDSDGFRNQNTTLTVNSTDLDCDDAGEGSSTEPSTDCDDSDDSVYPNAPEIVNDGVDQSCDNGDACYVDGDNDGFRTIDTTLLVNSNDLDCNDSGEGSSSDPPTDCDDTDSSINPNASEVIDDGIDQDCDNGDTCYVDADSDGYRHTNTSLTVNSQDLDCNDAGEGRGGEPATDCDDSEATTYPGASEVVDDGIDQDCDNGDTCYVDNDNDGFRNQNTTLTIDSADLDCDDDGEAKTTDPSTDCNDNVASVYPGAPEVVDDGIDQDCFQGDLCYADSDSDGYRASDTSLSVVSSDLDCNDNGEGSTNEPATDCDDSEATTYPGATELIDDGVNQDCSGGDLCYVDSDSDGFRNSDISLTVSSNDLDCDDIGEGSTSEPATDCNDSAASIYPGAPEVVNDGIDQDCDLGDTCFVDNDNDGYRTIDTSLIVLSVDLDCIDSGEASSSDPAEDCDDTNSSVKPGVSDFVDDGVDQNCDGFEVCFVDDDSDGYRNTDTSLTVNSSDLDCDDSGEGSTSEPATDCDDTASSINPGATEIVADEIDQNCDTDETCYKDSDNDGFRTTDTSLTVNSNDLDCDDLGEGASSEPSTDCNDFDPAINPSITEVIDNGVDQDCDGFELCFSDSDSDGFRSTDTSLTVNSSDLDCDDTGEGSSSEPATDCNDADANINPSSTEGVDDGVDQNCNSTELCYVDNDNDGFRTIDTTLTILSSNLTCTDTGEGQSTDPASDCDDNSASINPNASEIVADGIDQDCDSVDSCYQDADDDGFRTVDISIIIDSNDLDCTDSGEALPSAPATDCNDNDFNVKPGVSELVGDQVDQNCDGSEVCYVDSDDDDYRTIDTSLTVFSSDLDCLDAGEGLSSDPATDCDDANPNRNPSFAEICDGLDNDCNSQVDDGLPQITVYADTDLDGFGDIGATPDSQCGALSGWSTVNTDCDDSDPSTFPGAAPNDDPNACMTDADDDDYGDQNTSGTVVGGTDCDDTVDTIYPLATETTADGTDSNCDGLEAATGIDDCEGDFIQIGTELIYQLSCDYETTWQANRNYCVLAGYDGMVRFYSDAERLSFESILKVATNDTDGEDFWIDLRDDVDADGSGEDEYYWLSDSTNTLVWLGDFNGSSPNGLYTKWKSGEPISHPTADCTVQRMPESEWETLGCTSQSHSFTCEKRF